MQLQLSFIHPRSGQCKMQISEHERIQISRGRVIRVPADKKSLLNSIPVKYLTSIKILDAKLSQCTACKKSTDSLLCSECIMKIAKNEVSKGGNK